MVPLAPAAPVGTFVALTIIVWVCPVVPSLSVCVTVNVTDASAAFITADVIVNVALLTVGGVENPEVDAMVIEVNLLVVPSNALIVTFDKVSVCVPAALANTDCAWGEAEINTNGTAFLTFDKLNVSVTVLLVPSESVTIALIFTVVEFIPSAKVWLLKVTTPVVLFTVKLPPVSTLVAVNVAGKVIVEPL